jgi:signal transduction histidine kinase
MNGAVVARLASRAGFWLWLPVVVLPPVLVADAAIAAEGSALTAPGLLAAVVGCLPLLLRRRLPFHLLAPLLVAGIVLILWQLEPHNTVVLIPMVALVELAAYGDRRRSAWIAISVLPCVLISVLPFAADKDELVEVVVRNFALCLLAVAVGDVIRSRRQALERARAQREEEALRRLGDERLRIARDIHDVVAHAMVAINVQAGVAAHLIDRDPEQAHSALRAIKATSGEALADLRATLGVLRGDDAAAPVRPAAGLGDIDELAAGLRAAGVRVDVEFDETLREAPAAVHAAGYRIVQEALTNVLRHAGASSVRVTAARDGDEVRIDVVDDGAGAGAEGGAGSGHGLRGMRERASALDGTLEAGPAASGRGWRVVARLPAAVPELRARA